MTRGATFLSIFSFVDIFMPEHGSEIKNEGHYPEDGIPAAPVGKLSEKSCYPKMDPTEVSSFIDAQSKVPFGDIEKGKGTLLVSMDFR